MAVILGASELASFAAEYDGQPSEIFAIIKSGDPSTIAKEVTEAPVGKYG